jgi:hypothetical protein
MLNIEIHLDKKEIKKDSAIIRVNHRILEKIKKYILVINEKGISIIKEK